MTSWIMGFHDATVKFLDVTHAIYTAATGNIKSKTRLNNQWDNYNLICVMIKVDNVVTSKECNYIATAKYVAYNYIRWRVPYDFMKP